MFGGLYVKAVGKPLFGVVLIAGLLAGSPFINAQGRRAAASEEPAAQNGEAAQNNASTPIPPETKSETKHDWTAGSRPVHYTATAGNLLIRDDADKPNGSIFYVAYTEDGVPSKTRPITFLYNGGPGSATIWLHMGSVGPIRVVVDTPDAANPAPFKWVPNQYSLLDKSDLVFIDAPLAGYSLAVGKGTAKDFAGVDQDVKAFEKFIIHYLTLNQRWNSPKFLFGESYGTPRSAALVAALNNDGVQFNGVTLLSSILNYYVRSPGYDLDSTTYLPSYAAIAWHFKKVPHTGSIETFVESARKFSRGPYAEALQQGDALSKAKFDEIAQQLAGFTGLSVQFVKEAKLRLPPTRFRKELLRTEGETIGRLDARFIGYDAENVGDSPGYDPADIGITGPYVGALHEYLQTELKYNTQENYNLTAPGMNGSWDWHHRPSGSGGGGGGAAGGRGQEQPNTVLDLSDAMRKNPHLKVFSANGWFDLATPFFGTEHDLGMMMLPDALKKNVQFGYYASGHMVYIDVDALKGMHTDLERWYGEVLSHP
jgi:carboxypeptidase C (cathepsin A)